MSLLLTLHLLAVGIWIGVVAAEFVIEFDGMKNNESLIKASKLHFLTDIWVEIPAFTIVLITGLLMINSGHLQGIFFYKIIFGLAAIIFNIVCVYAVFRRRSYAIVGDIDGMQLTDPEMKIGGGGFIPTFLITIFIAIYLVIQ
jgi:hypothetical protein